MHSNTGDAAVRRTPGIPLLARTIRGIEWIAAAEISHALTPSLLDIGHREVRFELPELSPDLVHLGTLDDLFVIAYDGPPTGRTRADLHRLVEAVDLPAVDHAVHRLEALQPRRVESVDVSASFLGRRNYSRYDVEDSVGESLRATFGWRYESRRSGSAPAGDLSIRVHLTAGGTTVAFRLAARPLHRRVYRVASRPGALHPPLARAVALLAGLQPGQTLLDPFCGTGTIPIEAKLACPELAVEATDIDPRSIAATRRNAITASAAIHDSVSDAATLPYPSGSIDRVAANMPWRRNVKPSGLIAGTLRPLWAELDRVLPDTGRVALLAPPDAIPDHDRGRPALEVLLRNRVRISGAVAEIVVLARHHSGVDAIDTAGLLGFELNAAARKPHRHGAL